MGRKVLRIHEVHVMMNKVFCLVGLGLIPSTGCFRVPGPDTPAGMSLDIGANHRGDAINRWVCDGVRPGSVVLSRDERGLLLHDETYDGIARVHHEDDTNAYFQWSSSGVDVAIAASKSQGGPLVFGIRTAQGAAPMTCQSVAVLP
jgi:hypothetical protein